MTKTAFYESRFKDAFSSALESGLTKENANEYTKVYNALYAAGLEFLENVVMNCKSCSLKLRSAGYDAADAARECATHIFWNRLDYVLSADVQSAIPLTVEMAKRKVHDIFEKEMSLYRRLEDTDEYGWSIIHSDSDIESTYISRESALVIINTLAENKNKLEAIAFLATKLMGIKTGTLCSLLMSDKREQTIKYVLTSCAAMLGLESSVFENAMFFGSDIVTYQTSEKEFAKEISRASDRAKNKIKKALSC